MIIYDLRCEKNHRFEGWFQDSQAFADQLSGQLITCPVCSSLRIEMVPSNLAILGKDNREAPRQGHPELSTPQAMQMLHRYLEKNFVNVGERFAEVALKIHHGEEDRRNIKGTTTPQEEETLREEGVPFLKIPIPKFDS